MTTLGVFPLTESRTGYVMTGDGIKRIGLAHTLKLEINSAISWQH